MKKIFLSLTLAVLTLLVFAGCTPKTHKVTFKLNNGQSDVIKEVKHGQKAEKPNNPVNEGFVFQFWAENGKEFDFNTKIEKDHILTATWTEQTTGLKVVLPEGIKVTTPNVDLTNLNKGTKLDFEITVPNYHLVKSLLANTSDIIGNLKEGKKFSFTVNKNVTFKVTFDVLPEVKGELNTQLGKVTDIVVKKLETDPKLTLEQVKAKVAEKLDLTLVDLEVAQKDEKFVVTLTSKKVNTLKVEKEITVTYEKLDTHVVSANQNFTVLTPNVELNAVKHGTELEFQVVVPTGKVVDTLKANNKDIKATLTTDNKFKYIVNEDVTFEVTFKFDEAILNQEVEAELNKIENLAFDLVDDQQEKTEAELKALLETKVNTELVTLQLVKNTTDYTVTLTSKKLETVTKTKNITVTYNKFYSVTVPAEITVEGGQDLTKVPANTKLTFVIAVPQNNVIKTLLANEENIFDTLSGNKFEYTVAKKVEFKVAFTINPEVEQEVQTELDKLVDQTFDLVDDEQQKTDEQLKEILKGLVQESLVELELTKNTNDYTVTLTSKKLPVVKKQKTITVTYKQFYSVNVPTEIKVEGEQVLTKVPANKELTFVVTIPENNKVTKLTANEESILNTLNGDKFQYTVTKKVQFAVEFAEKQKLVVTVPTQIKVEPATDLQQVLEGTTLTFVVTIPEYQVVDTLTANTNDIKDLLKGNKFEYTINDAVTFAVTFVSDPDIEIEVEDELAAIESTIKALKLLTETELSHEQLVTAIEEKVDTTLVTVTLVKNESDYTVKLTSKKVPSLTKEKNITINVVNAHKVTIDLNGGNFKGKTGVVEIRVEVNTTLQNFDPQRNGYKFLGLYNDTELYDVDQPVNSDLTLKAKWADIFIKFERNGIIYIQGVIDEDTQNLFIPGTIDGKEVEILGKAFTDNLSLASVTIGEGVRRIGSMAFYNVKQLSSVVLPKTLEFIGNRAFYAAKITDITIPASVKEIDHLAFADSYLNNVTFENSNFHNIDKSVFQGTPFYGKSLTEQRFHVINNTVVEVKRLVGEYDYPTQITLPVGTRAIGRRVFYGFSQLTRVFNTEGLEFIGDEAFRGANVLESLTLSRIRYIGNYAFEGASNLTSIQLQGLEFLGTKAFANTGLTSVTIPETLKVIGDFAFDGTTQLVNIQFHDQIERIGQDAFRKTAWLDGRKATSLVIESNILINADSYDPEKGIPANVVRIAGGAFNNVPVEKVTIPKTVKFLDKYAIQKMTSMKELNFSGTTKLESFSIVYDRIGGLTINIDSVSDVPSDWPEDWVTIHSNRSKLQINWALEVTIKFDLNYETTEQIPEQTVLKGNSIKMPDKPVRSGYIFIGWKKKSGSILVEGEQMFESQTLVAQWTQQNDIFDYQVDNLEIIITGLKEGTYTTLDVPNQITGFPVVKIADGVFKNQTSLKTLTLPDTLKEIGENAFENTGLTEITIPNTITKLNNNLFLNSQNLATINLGTNVNLIGEDVFTGTAWLANQRQNNENFVIVNGILVDASQVTGEVLVPETVKVVNTNAFKGTQATSITLQEGATTVRKNALVQSSTVTQIVIPRSVEVIEANAFNVERLTIEIPTRYSAPTTFVENWDLATNGKHIVNFKPEDRFVVTIIGNHEVITPDINLQKVSGGTTIEIKLIPNPGFIVSKLLINGKNQIAKLNTETNVFSILVEKHLNISFEQIKNPVIVAEMEEQKAKLETPIYYGQGLEEKYYKEFDLVSEQVSKLLDTTKVSFTLRKDEEVAGVKYYTVTLISRKDPSFTEEIQFPLVLANFINNQISTQANGVNNKWSGGATNNYYGPKNLIDFGYPNKYSPNDKTSWRSSNEGFELNRRFIVIKTTTTLDFRFFLLLAQKDKGTEPEYKVYVANTQDGVFPEESDWKEVAHVVTEPGKISSSAGLPQGTLVNYIKLVILKSHPSKDINEPQSFSLAHFGVYGFVNTVNVDIDLNGGNVEGDQTNKVITIEENGKVYKQTLPNIVKENYVIDYFEKDGVPFDLFNEIITTNINVKVIWKEDIKLNKKIAEELNKVKNKFVVETDGELTVELITNQVKTFINNELVDVEVTASTEGKYNVVLKHKVVPTIALTKEVTVLKRTPGEKVQLTFILNGGNISGSQDNVVVQVLKGKQIGSLLPKNPRKQYYNFVGWLNSEGVVVDFEELDIFEEETYTAKFEVRPELGQGINVQLNKVYDELGFADGTIDAERVKTHVESIIDVNNYTVEVEQISTIGKTHKVTIISKKITEIRNSKDIYVNKLVELTYPKTIKIDGKASPNSFVLGTTKQLTIELPSSRRVKEIIINSVNVTNQLQENSYNLLIEETFEVVIVDEVNPEYVEYLQNEVNKVTNLKFKKDNFSIDDIIKEVKKILTNEAEYTITVVQNEEIGLYTITITSKVEQTLTASKQIKVLKVASLNEFINQAMYHNNGDFSSQANNREKASFAFDRNHDGGPNINTKWCSTKSGTNFIIMTFVGQARLLTGFKLTNAGVKEDRKYNTRSFRILGSNKKNGEYVELYFNNNNSETYVEADLNPIEAYKYIKLEILQGEQNGNTARIYDITLFGVRL